MRDKPVRVLFLCTHNAARTQMAEALLKQQEGDRFDVFSAGTEPRPVDSLAIRTMAAVRIDISTARSKHLDEYVGETFDYVSTDCNAINESCPVFPGDPERVHWSYDDSSAADGTKDERFMVEERIGGEITRRLQMWILAIDRVA